MTMMTDKQAYAAMYHFLKETLETQQRLRASKSTQFYVIYLPRWGFRSDPAMLHDWQEAVILL